jgi:hypothetical protein
VRSATPPATSSSARRAGLLDERSSAQLDTEAAIRADPRLTQSQMEPLLGVYRDFAALSEN